MYNISTVEEARKLLAKDDLSPADVRELFLYFLQRDEETRSIAQKVMRGLAGVFGMLPFMMTQITRTIPRDEPETVQQLEDLLKELKQLAEVLHTKISLQ